MKEQPCARPHQLQRERQEQAELVPSHSRYCFGQFVSFVPQVKEVGVRSAKGAYQLAPL